MTLDNTEQCSCIVCSTAAIFPAAASLEDRTPSIVGIDVSTKFIAIGVVQAIGEINDIGAFGFSIDSKRDTERCAEAAEKTLAILSTMQESIDITSIAIEMPRGFGGKLIPIVGAITGVFGMGNLEWYAPSTWQSIIKKNYGVSKEDVAEAGIKPAIHKAIANAIGSTTFFKFTEDMRDAISIAIAHRIETLASDDLSDYDIKWLEGEARK